MPVVGVLAEAFVGHQQRPVAVGLAQRAQRLLHDAVLLQRRGADGVLARGDAEEDERSDAAFEGRADLAHEGIDAELKVAGHRGDLLADALAGPHEQRQDEVARGEGGRADRLANEGGVAEASGAGGGEFGWHEFSRWGYRGYVEDARRVRG